MNSWALVEGVLAVDENLADVAAQTVPDGPDDDVVLLVEEFWRLEFGGGLLDGLVQLQQVFEIPLQVFRIPVDAGRAYDHPHPVRYVQRREGFAQGVAVLAVDASRDAPGAGVVRHQDEVARRKA